MQNETYGTQFLCVAVPQQIAGLGLGVAFMESMTAAKKMQTRTYHTNSRLVTVQSRWQKPSGRQNSLASACNTLARKWKCDFVRRVRHGPLLATLYLLTGKLLWSRGIFLWRQDIIESEFGIRSFGSLPTHQDDLSMYGQRRNCLQHALVMVDVKYCWQIRKTPTICVSIHYLHVHLSRSASCWPDIASSAAVEATLFAYLTNM